jgi:sugar phosphate permease
LIAKFNIVTLMVLFSVMSYFDRTNMSVAGPGIILYFGISKTQMGGGAFRLLLGYATETAGHNFGSQEGHIVCTLKALKPWIQRSNR